MAANREDGLLVAYRALAALVEDRQQLDRARWRLGESPPSYRTNLSGAIIRPQSPNPLSEEQQSPEERQIQLRREHRASLPCDQFEVQVSEECRCIYKEGSKNCSPLQGLWLPDREIRQRAAKRVKKRWVDQGIWKDEWNHDNKPHGPWKHEEPLKFESESETDSDAEPGPVSAFGLFGPSRPAAKPRRPKSDIEMRRIAERRPVREAQHEASRPYHQFDYQVSQTRERIQDESRAEGVHTEYPVDINTKAYEDVKNTWIKRGIWNRKWGILPGMSWKHERPLEELMADDPVFAQTNELEDHGRAARKAPPSTPPIGLFGRPTGLFGHSTGLFGPPRPIESNHNQALGAQPELPVAIDLPSTAVTTPPHTERTGILGNSAGLFGSARVESNHNQAPGAQPELPVAIDPAGLQNDNSNHSSPGLRSRRHLTQSGRESPEEAQRPLRGGRPEARASLGPVNPSKVSKAPRERAPVPPRPPNTNEVLRFLPEFTTVASGPHLQTPYETKGAANAGENLMGPAGA
ncbi:hypothetical protein B0I35DRAFT_413146 [Stachybotrys elegans]|uniref:Uncharacterized protein n=1 Tax=Stachybotrys elegans TaxID=80388 RepID=A0A8K0SCU5_9HYPO|nr:hypothetical protein B0I35DRAFT_413146 [Stachybotrys elegans]